MEKLRSKILYLFVTLILVVSTVLLPQQAFAESMDKEDKGPAMVADLILARPFGLAATIVGSAVFAVTLPFSLVGGNVLEVAQTLVIEPAKFTFVRPLGGD